MNTHNKIALSDIRPSEVQSKLEKVKDLVQEHEAIQTRIEELTGEEDEEFDFEEDSEMLLKHAKIIDDFEDLSRAHQAWSEGYHIQHEANVLLSTSTLNTTPCRTSYEKLKLAHATFLKLSWAHPSRRHPGPGS